ncbi:conserved membrane protein of unknown function [Candidatus Filomicrobium marinum]|uniref:Sodium/calcium exchanger membrane region domain-containing protein n=1 Tax=Candidatus Filomicrobium marinum TaxID=1608628 RepID=A0A0D6JB55_9HYPH|nr:sodium:calcium exchanger [Candidatus Filomicrobium marinum]CFX04735.1 conserved membrane protein of unknown function [Candidatus Filomicrobium marinum]CPR16115.1 conserved membrane protein of unknown function [Candidatus Filomicrobium marinum]
MPSFEDLGLAGNVAAFLAAAFVVWRAGYRMSHYADIISVKTGLGHALLGLLLLGGVTSLPEVAVTVTASAGGNAPLAINNILGGVAMQVTILAIADFAIGRRALTSVVPDPVVLLQGALNIVLLSIAACAAIAGDIVLGGVGLFSWIILVMFLLSIWILTQAEQRKPWLANLPTHGSLSDASQESAPPNKGYEMPLSAVLIKAGVAGALILVAGFVVARTAEIIADETGIGQSFVGAALVAISTSLPEISTVLAAVRANLFTLAISDILGTNLFDVGLLFVVDAVGDSSPALASAGKFGAVAAVLGILVTALFLVGLAERRDRTIFRLGIDSIAVLVAYVGGMALLFTLR